MKSKGTVQLPAEVLRKEYHYRTPNPKTGLGEMGCGFVPRTERSPRRGAASPKYFGLLYLLRGGGTVALNGSRPRRVQVGDVIQVPAGCRLTVIPDRPIQWVEAFVCVDMQLLRRIALIHNLDVEKPLLRIGLDLLLVRQFQQITTELVDPTPLSLQGTMVRVIELILTIHQMSRPEAEVGEEDLIAKACRMLETNLAARLDMESVAAQLGLGYHHFRRIFRQQLGVSPGQYRIYCRLQRARLMLMHEHKSMAEVANELGYADPFVFSKQFKKVVGQPPSQFLGK